MTGSFTSIEDDAGRDEYFRAIEEHFASLRGSPLVLSPHDWQLVEFWHQQRIPLAVVRRALLQVFETATRKGRRTPVMSLSYCRHAVEAEHARHLQAGVGDTAETEQAFRAEAAAGRQAEGLRAKAAALEVRQDWPAAMHDEVRRVVADLRRLATAISLAGRVDEGMEEELLALEDRLLASLCQCLAPGEVDAAEATCRRRLEAARATMSAVTYARTLQHALDGELRRAHGLPRLSLLVD